MMTRNMGEKAEGLAIEVWRQLGGEAMTRFLRTLPAFRTEADFPDRLRELLDRLEGAENGDVGWRRR